MTATSASAPLYARALGSISLPGYAIAGTIGEGGMGEIVLAHDHQLGRDVAIKRLRSATPTQAQLARFFREARIQARLAHPAIVPVHELGFDAAGQPFFTMKRITGVTLAEYMSGAHRASQQSQLRAFIDVCLAVEFAHRCGVVHRDLKPANVMLGDFGEVYVLDWGVARVLAECELADASRSSIRDGTTEVGMMLGTPGYMAPEQIDDAARVGPAADVYALGAILFELLAGEPVHPRGKRAIASTLAGGEISPASRRPDRGIAPEMDAIVSAALAYEPAARPSARALGEGVQRYLDGDRDVERRRVLALAEVANARSAVALDQRAEAMRSAGRALALDPESHDAAALITSLMLEPPRELPRELAHELASTEISVQRRQGRVAVLSLCAVMMFLLAAAVHGLRSVPWFFALAGWTLVMGTLAWRAAHRAATRRHIWIIAIGNATLGALLSSVFGPFIVAPVVTCIMAVSLTSYPQLMAHARTVITLLVASWLLPVLLEQLGVLQTTWHVGDGVISSTSRVVEIQRTTTAALLIGANVLAIVVIGVFANALARSRCQAQREFEIQAWHLRQLLPK